MKNDSTNNNPDLIKMREAYNKKIQECVDLEK